MGGEYLKAFIKEPVSEKRNPAKIKSPRSLEGFRYGAGEEGRTPDLMLGNDEKRKRRR